MILCVLGELVCCRRPKTWNSTASCAMPATKGQMMVLIASHPMWCMVYTGCTSGKTSVPVSAFGPLLPQIICDIFLAPDSFLEEWVESSAFRPSNKLLIKKIFSAILDRTPVDPKLWGAISCPVLVIHGGKCEIAPFNDVSIRSSVNSQRVMCRALKMSRGVYSI